MKLKSIVAAAVLATGGVAAHAGLYTASGTGLPTVYSFTEATAFYGSGVAFGSMLSGYDLYMVSGAIPTLTYSLAETGTYTGSFPLTNYTLENKLFSAGTYALVATGTGAYGLSYSTTAAPVPEPETYALMLAGLGAIGFVARRRNNS